MWDALWLVSWAGLMAFLQACLRHFAAMSEARCPVRTKVAKSKAAGQDVASVQFGHLTRYEFEAAWVPFTADRTLQAAAELAMEWAENVAAVQRRPAVLITDVVGEYHGHEPFDRYRGRHFSPRSRSKTLDFQPGAVIVHAPTPNALDFAMRLANGTALAVVENPSPWGLAGWAGAVGARNLITGEVATLDPRLMERLQHLRFYGNNGYAPGFGRDGAQRVLNDLHADGLLDRDAVVSALAGLGMSADSQETINTMIARMLPTSSRTT